jgi:lipopolysaccharide biosynthesis glycosyltransferase
MRTSDVFKEYNNILHLDADTLVMNNLDNLMNFDEFYTVQEAYQ